jgi:hypothetical protein
MLEHRFFNKLLELNRVMFRVNQLLRLVQVNCELVVRRPIETAPLTGLVNWPRKRPSDGERE